LSSDNHHSENQIELDFDRLARIGEKVNELLVKRAKGSAEAYAVLRFLCVYYEEELGIAFEPQFEAELRRVVQKSLHDRHENCDCGHDHECTDPECQGH
jgi:hypothetical protein